MPCSGVTLKVEVTWALPPPVSVGAAEAAGPITATVPAPFAAKGRVPPEFFSSTVPASATEVETAWFAGVVTTALVDPVGGVLKSLNLNISGRRGPAMPLTRAIQPGPSCPADSRAGP